VGIVGELITHTYEDRRGEKRKSTKITVNELEFLTPKPTQEVPQDPKQGSLFSVEDGDDIPF